MADHAAGRRTMTGTGGGSLSSLALLPFSSMSPADLPAVYAMALPKNARGRIDLKTLLAFSRQLRVARGAAWDVELALERLEGAPGHDEAIEDGFDQGGFIWAAERELKETELENEAEIARKERMAEEDERAAQEAEEEEERQDALDAAEAEREREEALAAAAASVPDSTAQFIAPSAAHTSSTPASLSSSAPTASAFRHDAAQLLELEALYERQNKELDKTRAQLRQYAKLRTEYDNFRDEAERREEEFHESVELLQIKLTRERHKTKLASTSFETRVNELTLAASTATEQLATMQSEHDRLQAEHAKAQVEATKVPGLTAELAEAQSAATKAQDAAKVSTRTSERLEKKLVAFDTLTAEHEQLREAHQAQANEAANLAAAYDQLHAAYSAEEQLFKDAQARVQQLELVLGETKIAEATAAGSGSGTELGLASPRGGGATKPSVERESLLSDLLDVDVSTNDGESLTSPTANAAGVMSPPTSAVPQAPSATPSAPPSAPHSSRGSRRSSTSSGTSGRHTPASSTTPGTVTPASSVGTPSKRLSFSFNAAAAAAAPSTPAAPQIPHSLIPTTTASTAALIPGSIDAKVINFHFFQLVALSVFSSLAASPDLGWLATRPLPVQELYEEAMAKQVEATKYADWIEQRLRTMPV